MKKFFLSCLLLSSCSCFAQTGNYRISGKIGHFNAPVKMYLRYVVGGDKIVVDSALIHDGNFEIRGTIDGERDVNLLIDYTGKGLNKSKMTHDAFPMYLEKGTLNVFSADSLQHLVITNSPINAERARYEALFADQTAYISKNVPLYFAQVRAKSPDSLLMRQYEKKLDSAEAVRVAIVRKFIKEHPDSYFSLVSIRNLDPFNDLNKSLPLFNLLSERIRNTPVGKETQASFAINAALTNGKIAPDFAVNDQQNQPVSLSSFRGHFVLLDFWASWCGPCRVETPHIAGLLKKYKNRNFTIFSVSIDVKSARQDWLDAIKKDGMTWTNGITSSDYKSPELKPYNLMAIPKTYLIDPSGKIIGQDLKGIELEQKLEAVLTN